MTLEIDGVDVGAALEIAGVVGGIIAMLVIGLLIYLLVRPPRHVRDSRRQPVEMDESEAAQLIDLMERMESRLEVLERALGDDRASAEPAAPKLLESAEAGRELRRNI